MTSGGQSIGDRLAAAQHTIVGSDVTKSVLKASTTEVMGPKKKHLEYLTVLAGNPNINIVELADSIVERTKNNKWVVVFKALITTHHLTCFGHERFLQHLASRNTLFNLAAFQDKSGVQGYDMSTYIRKYAKYLNEKAVSYRIVAYDFTRVKRGKEDGQLKMLTSEKLLKTLPIIQQQLDALLEFDASSNELTNGVINAAFYMLFKDLIRLFACYNDGIINLLEKFFEMKKAHCKEGLDLYKKFLTRTGKVSELLKVAEQVGIDKGDIPDLTKAPSSLLDALEQHILSMDGKKIGKQGSKAGTPVHIPSAKPAVATTTPVSSSPLTKEQKAVAEEAAIFDKLMANSGTTAKPTNWESTYTTTSVVDQPTAPTSAAPTQPTFNSDLQFDLLTSSPTTTWPATANNQPAGDLFGNDFGKAPAAQAPAASWTNTSDLFGSDDLLTPTPLNGQAAYANQQQPQQAPTNGAQSNGTSLEASMANVLANLSMSGGQKSQQSFTPATQPKLTGGNNFQINTPAMTTMQPMTAPFRPMQPQQPVIGPTAGGFGMMRPPTYGTQMPGMMNYPGMMQQQQPQQQQMVAGNLFMPQQQPPVTNPFQSQPQQQPQFNANNPFGSMM